MKYILALILALTIFTVSQADKKHKKPKPAPNVTNVTEVTNVNNFYVDTDGRRDDMEMVLAMSAAGDTCVFDHKDGTQGCLGAGFYGSAQAINGSLAFHFDPGNTMLRVNLQASDDLDDVAGGIGGTWQF